MQMTQTMLELLSEIRRNAPRKSMRRLQASKANIGNLLIEYYYNTSDFDDRALIMEFMERAGFMWTKKLITRDTSAVNSAIQFASLEDYLKLAAANDPQGQWSKQA